MVPLDWRHSYAKEILLCHTTIYCRASAADLQILTSETAAATCKYIHIGHIWDRRMDKMTLQIQNYCVFLNHTVLQEIVTRVSYHGNHINDVTTNSEAP